MKKKTIRQILERLVVPQLPLPVSVPKEFGLKCMERAKKELDQAEADIKAYLPDAEEIEGMLKTTRLGWHYPFGEKGKPPPEPIPLYLHDYKVDLGGLMNLATAIAKRIGK